ncbi:GntR family transcriptional regulator [Dermatophilus congolensis]|uniref:Uncharacterized HTH-type transcriptional regulator ydfH n=1 Tax=Dermatophilus congolensis TaxID=1863 RepID=A0A239VTT2_9MICO|nr:GntR family transcriptional regulator [Dermatophilus congolensis]MBO3129975.1 GntR family transcriptional regulator [Dermatophilus congolensis]MBO3131395.1 GntR family transcriptional regulator [Dermatophilus congolensis]MBO3134450.1 GntR family transcriptional regulator [Dermatophilus congolensis]MBO3136685.1 GntR family transcriptional regulator [Dermatophilus congolensis]MBO3138929.1 GntR family transcriptional regulator [Dermatophilus congolensis]
MSRAISATERAYNATRGKILDGALAGGDVITEGAVSTELGISRTPVREAFLRLQAEGLLQLYPKRGAVVVPVTAEEALSVGEAREIIESFAVTKLLSESPEPPAELVDRLWECLNAQRQAIRAHNASAFIDADTSFHLAIVELSENDFFFDLYKSLRDHQRRLAVHAGALTPANMTASYNEHVKLAGLLSEGELDGYLAFLRKHLREGRKRMGVDMV